MSEPTTDEAENEARESGSVPLREVAELLARVSDGEMRMRLTDDYRWFAWDDLDPAGNFDVEVGGYMLSLAKDWECLCGIERAVAPDGRESEWPAACDFSHLMTREQWDGLLKKLRLLGNPD